MLAWVSRFLPCIHCSEQHEPSHGAENSEADPQSWRVESGTGRAFGLKQSSYRPEGWQHLILEGLTGFIAPNLKIMNFACRWLARAQSLWFEGPLDLASEAKFLHNHDSEDGNCHILFTSCSGQVKHSKMQQHQLTLGQFVLLPMQRWRWPVVEMFQISAIR